MAKQKAKPAAEVEKATKQITELTEAQRAKFPYYVDRWTKIGLCTDPADRPRAEKAIAGLYHLSNLPTPTIVWASCPISGVLVALAAHFRSAVAIRFRELLEARQNGQEAPAAAAAVTTDDEEEADA